MRQMELHTVRSAKNTTEKAALMERPYAVIIKGLGGGLGKAGVSCTNGYLALYCAVAVCVQQL